MLWTFYCNMIMYTCQIAPFTVLLCQIKLGLFWPIKVCMWIWKVWKGFWQISGTGRLLNNISEHRIKTFIGNSAQEFSFSVLFQILSFVDFTTTKRFEKFINGVRLIPLLHILMYVHILYIERTKLSPLINVSKLLVFLKNNVKQQT